jgi:hypothetical protein
MTNGITAQRNKGKTKVKLKSEINEVERKREMSVKMHCNSGWT